MLEPFPPGASTDGNSAEVRGLLVEARGASRSFGSRTIVHALDLRVHAGECLAIFGPNGAGKTTLLRLLAGLLRPTAGAISVAGGRLSSDADARARVGIITHQHVLYAALTGRENVRFAARLHGIADEAAVTRALSGMGALEFADVPVRALSRGMQQRVTIARALVHEPLVLLADEPYTALDEAGAREVAERLAEVRARSGAIVLVTHNAAEGAAVATRTARMDNGRFSEAA